MSRAAVLAALLAAACSSPQTGTRGAGNEARPPAPPAGSRFLCDRRPIDPRVSWRDCQRTELALQDRAFCFSARAASGANRLHSVCAPTRADCTRWHDARKSERNDVVDGCVPMRAAETGTVDGTPPPRDGQFLCEQKPDARRMVSWRDCKIVDVTAAPTAHCFVTSWRGGRHSVCAPNEAECRAWADARAADRKDVIAPCKLATPADYWPLPPP